VYIKIILKHIGSRESDPSNEIGAALTGLKLLMAYFGQHCHRSSHMPKNRRPKYVVALQNCGLMLDQTMHNGHHRAPHDENFCLIGFSDAVINALLKFGGHNDTAWFVLWLATTLFDVTILCWVLKLLVPSVYAA